MSLQHIKDGVLFNPITPELVDVIITVAGVWVQNNLCLVITSGSDGTHPAGGATDPHYLGYAIDVRTSDIDPHVLPLLIDTLKLYLGASCHVVLEKDHLHIQHQGFKCLTGSGSSSPLPPDTGPPIP